MPDDVILMLKLDRAHSAVESARRLADGLDVDSADYLRAQVVYLRAMVHHLSLLIVVQADQHERLATEVAELRGSGKDGPLH
jgi:hypothetical protein